MTDLFSPTPEPIDLVTARFARVAVERGIERAGRGAAPGAIPAIDATLTYRADDPAIAIGDRVRVPLGRGNRPAEGIVVSLGGRELLEGLAAVKVKPIEGRTGSALPAQLVELAIWLAQYYVCPLGMVFCAMMPAAVKRGVGSRTVTYVTLAAPSVNGDEPGSSSEDDRAPSEGAGSEAALSPAARRAWAAIQELNRDWFPMTPKALAAALDRVSTGTIGKLVAAGLLVESTREEVHARSTQPETLIHDPGSAPTPSPEQQAIINGITASLGSFIVHLIRGVTGSGKTEVYLRAIEECLARGQTAIVMVPEIALTPQTSGRFIERFGRGTAGGVAVLHSGLSAAQRHAQWAACASGAVRVVVGARSAVFAPLPAVGLIVVDEEHDSSYKQDQLPRYHARDVAVKRAQLLGCPVVLGSATPSLESWSNAQPARAHSSQLAAQSSKYRLWTLPDRVAGASLPRVQIVDLVEERRLRASIDPRDRHVHLIGPTLEAAIDRTLATRGQVILLLNKRGYANHVCCPDARCGWVLGCDQCDTTLVYHVTRGGDSSRERAGFVRCHHCLAEQLLPKKCPQCGRNVNTFGQGTQRVEEELERKFAMTHCIHSGTDGSEAGTGGAGTMLRVDSDSMTTARDYFEALDRFARGEVRILLGTQMIAKGLDFPNVRLVGVINADTALNLPDFRATERTFQLVSQVAGRAGRGTEPGQVIVQTFTPRAPSIQFAAAHDYEGFAAAELAERARWSVPPITRMARIVCRDPDYTKAMTAAAGVHAALADAITALADRAGRTWLRPPFPCPIARIAGQHRISVELRAQTRGVIQSVLGAVRAKGLLKSDSHTAVDVDPVALL